MSGSPRTRPVQPPHPPSYASEEGSTGSVQKSSDIWFDDGNLIIASEHVYFRVYKGIITHNSPVFADMVQLPQPRNVEEFEGCPVVRVHDTPTEIMHFLKALHDVSYFDLYTTESVEWACFSAVLRLSTKYQVERLRQRAHTLLSNLYPMSLARWDARDSITNLESFEARPFAVYLLAKETDLPTILPAALYLCADSQDINYILEGLKSHDGIHIELPWPEKKACIRAREALSLALRTRMFAFLTGHISFPGCRSVSTCNGARLKWLQGVEASLGSGVFSVSFPWEQLQISICEYCFTTSQNHHDVERGKLWDELPEMFGLPPWNQLHSNLEYTLAPSLD
ncbi:hypothetical protein V5O48_009295 [Marasmius crinis-equi]|uniref:BTB domain-containing protein n=1 Tax=Marasmius crinis-equi TaxID=585013 RepID=A0ABR3FC76_9AGAR